MELNVRSGTDRFVPAGAYRAIESRLRRRANELAEIPAVVVSAFDRQTRFLPFVMYESHLFPAGAATVAGALHRAGFQRTRAVFQLWNPRIDFSRVHLDGRPLELLLVSTMAMHSRSAYGLIKDARSGSKRPLIIAGGPKAIYEPHDFWLTGEGTPRPAPDVVVTGEVYVLMQLLDVLVQQRGRGDTMRSAFERSVREGVLDAIPGLVYQAPGSTPRDPVLVDTGLQRLVQDYDDPPGPVQGLSLLERPHRNARLDDRPLTDAQVAKHVMFVSLPATQGCRFTCPYCPIPAVNQRTWRSRSPDTLVRDIAMVHDRFGIKYFFFADDNFFNDRSTAEMLLTRMADATTRMGTFGQRIRFGTEATEVDTYRNRDLLGVARRAGMHSIWFGIEDLTASLVKKGQKPERTLELFRLMHEHRISPMPMLMYHEGQPFHTRDSLYGLSNQVDFLRRAGAISIQCTVHIPAAGSREREATYATGGVLRRVGRLRTSDAHTDGNHVLVVGREAPWKRQIKLIGGYATFYNPLNLVRAFRRDGSRLRRRRVGYQAVGMLATVWTAVRLVPYTLRLLTGRLECHQGPLAVEPLPVLRPTAAFPRFPTTKPEPERQRLESICSS